MSDDAPKTAFAKWIASLDPVALSIIAVLVHRIGGTTYIDSEDMAMAVDRGLEYSCERGTFAFKIPAQSPGA